MAAGCCGDCNDWPKASMCREELSTELGTAVASATSWSGIRRCWFGAGWCVATTLSEDASRDCSGSERPMEESIDAPDASLPSFMTVGAAGMRITAPAAACVPMAGAGVAVRTSITGASVDAIRAKKALDLDDFYFPPSYL